VGLTTSSFLGFGNSGPLIKLSGLLINPFHFVIISLHIKQINEIGRKLTK